MYDTNDELIARFLSDSKLWNNLDVVLQKIAAKDPNRLAQLNAKITSITLHVLNQQKSDKIYALNNLYMSVPKKTSLLFFEMFWATRELYPEPSDILSDCDSNIEAFKIFIKEYHKQKNLENWRSHYDNSKWLDKLDNWLLTNEGKAFLTN